MSLLRLLSVSAFASTCVISAAAQSPAQSPATPNPTPPATTFSTPQYTFPHTFTPQLSTPSPFLLNSQQPGTFLPFNTPKTTPAPPPTARTLSATNDGCFTMRSYGFTARDLQSSAPRPSSSTTCTPAHTVTLKDATLTSTK